MTAAADVDLHQVPGHVAIVGGGVDEASLADVVDGALSIGLRWLTIEVLPGEGWGDPLEVSRRAFADAERLLLARRDDLHRRGVRIRGLGRRDERVPQRLRPRRRRDRGDDRRQPRDDAHPGRRPRRPGGAGRRDGGAGDRGARGPAAAVVDRRGRARRPPHRARPARPRSHRPHRRRDHAPPASWCGSRRTRSWCSPTSAGPRSAATTSSPRSPSTSAANAASAPSNLLPSNISKFAVACAREPRDARGRGRITLV